MTKTKKVGYINYYQVGVPPEFIPLWKINGYKSKEDGMIKVIKQLLEMGEVITWNRTVWGKEHGFDKD